METIYAPVVTPANAFVVTVTDVGTQNDYAPVGFTGQPVLIRANNATSLTITGFARPISGQQVTVVSVGSGHVFVANETGSISTNQLSNIATTGLTPLAAGKGTATYIYDGITAKWRLIAHEQGYWLTPAFSASDYTANGAMTWTVDAADVVTCLYWLSGRTMAIMLSVNTTSVGGTLNTDLLRAIPGGFAASGYAFVPVFVTDAGVNRTGLAVPSASTLKFLKDYTTANWSASANNTSINASVVIQVI